MEAEGFASDLQVEILDYFITAEFDLQKAVIICWLDNN
jgi:hypothetical protein